MVGKSFDFGRTKVPLIIMSLILISGRFVTINVCILLSHDSAHCIVIANVASIHSVKCRCCFVDPHFVCGLSLYGFLKLILITHKNIDFLKLLGFLVNGWANLGVVFAPYFTFGSVTDSACLIHSSQIEHMCGVAMWINTDYRCTGLCGFGYVALVVFVYGPSFKIARLARSECIYISVAHGMTVVSSGVVGVLVDCVLQSCPSVDRWRILVAIFDD